MLESNQHGPTNQASRADRRGTRQTPRVGTTSENRAAISAAGTHRAGLSTTIGKPPGCPATAHHRPDRMQMAQAVWPVAPGRLGRRTTTGRTAKDHRRPSGSVDYPDPGGHADAGYALVHTQHSPGHRLISVRGEPDL